MDTQEAAHKLMTDLTSQLEGILQEALRRHGVEDPTSLEAASRCSYIERGGITTYYLGKVAILEVRKFKYTQETMEKYNLTHSREYRYL